MILICYDGSEDARAAIGQAAELFPNESASVLTVWQPFVQLASRAAIGYGVVPTFPNPEEIDEATRTHAEQVAAEGAELAQQAGLTATAASCAQGSTIGRAILSRADEAGAGAIVMGSRGLTGLKSLLLGSVSHEVIQHADRAVVVVPSPRVAASRAEAMDPELSHASG